MDKKIAVFVTALLALGALEFGLLGASASGLVGGSSGALPRIAQRVQAPATITPVATATVPPITANVVASIELQRPDPAAIECDGAHSSTVRVFLRDRDGHPVPNGTPVTFATFNGSSTPYYTFTDAGAASTSVVLYSDSYSQQPNVVVRSGDMETAVRLRCRPNSGCPLSPPASVSPPCGAQAPLPCNPSPGSDVNSPPCAVQTPISPPICAPNQTSPPCTPLSPPPCKPWPANSVSPPCATPAPPPTPVSPPSPPPPCTGFVSPPAAPADCQYEMRLDADPGHSGIQPTRRIVGDQPFTIGIDVTKVGKVPYAGYQWSVQFANSELGFESYAENMSLTGLGLCVNPPNVSSDPQIVILYGGCITTDLNVPAQFVGGTTTIALHCLKSGQIQIALLTTLQGNGFGSSLLNKHGDELPTTLTGITIDCQVGGAEACADATGDGRVTRDDLRFIIGNMSRLHPDLRADVNGDGRVDRKDLSQATKQLGTRC